MVASRSIQEGRLVFVERPVVAMQSLGNMHEGVLVCNYCMAFCGSPKQSLQVASSDNPAEILQEIITGNKTNNKSASDQDCCRVVDEGSSNNIVLDTIHNLHKCRHNCGHIYCSLECQQDDWEWGGHRELCTGTIPESIPKIILETTNEDNDDSDENNGSGNDLDDDNLDPLLKFKIHAVQTNEIFMLVATWLVRILKHNLPYHENDFDDSNTHPYTDFMMNPWWEVKLQEGLGLAKLAPGAEQEEQKLDHEEIIDDTVEKLVCVLKELCKESHSYLSQVLEDRLPNILQKQWLTPTGIARLIGSLEQNCLGIRRKHVLQHNILRNKSLRQEFQKELIQCLEKSMVLLENDDNDDDDSSCGCGGSREDETSTDTTTSHSNGSSSSSTIKDSTVMESNIDDNDSNTTHNNDKEDQLEYNDAASIAGLLANLKNDLTHNCVFDDWDRVFTPLDGVAHYSTVSKMNHSCEPNVILVYKSRGWGRDHPLVAYVVALRDIQEGEELMISYIDSEDVSYEKRQAALANYGFVCECSKCEIENAPLLDKAEGMVEDISTNDDDEDDLFGDSDDDDLFGEDDDDKDDSDDELEDRLGDDELLCGEERLAMVAKRLDSIYNRSNHIAIPLTSLAQVSTYIVRQISSLIQDIEVEEDSNNNGKQEIIVKLLEQNMNAIRERDFASCRIAGSALELFLYDELQSKGSWQTPVHRASYLCASTTASVGYAHEGSFLVAMKYLDKAMILGQDRKIIQGFFDYVENHASEMAATPCPISIKCNVSDFQCRSLRELVATKALPRQICFPVNELNDTIDSNTTTEIFTACKESRPLVIRSLASRWKAVEKWRNIDNLARKFGHRLVPVEVGSMSSNKMKEILVPFRSFVSKYLCPSAEIDCWSLDDATADSNHRIAYLAQHPLLDQIPALCRDIDMTPCEIQPTNINIWMGTGGTRTPLHFDTYDNLLVQIVGAKYVRLYKKEYTSQLYVSTDKNYGAQGNMSDLDCERENFDLHPRSRECEYTEVILYPGDCLFIPSREWHYVRSLSTSVSVNYWF